MGRPAKPTALKVMQGTARQHPERINRQEPATAGETKIPPWLPETGPARDAWHRLLPPLQRMRVLSDGDAEALALGCVALEDYLEARKDEESWRKADSAWKRYGAMLGWFGLNPSARAKVHAAPAAKSDPLAEWKAG